VGQFDCGSLTGWNVDNLHRIFRLMAARDRFEMDINCPSCGVGGTAQVSEEDYPFMRNPGFRVDAFPEGLSEAKRAPYRHETEVKCQCGKVFCL